LTKYGNYNDLPVLAELYDLVPAYINRIDREFYLNYSLNIGGKTLELGCGTGRVLIPIAKAGINITGLDLSDNMLSVCRKKLTALDEDIQKRVTLINGSMTDFNIDDKFNLITIPFRAFQHILSVDDQLSCFKCINRHLGKNGLLIFDVFLVNLKIIANPRINEEIDDFPEYELDDGRRLRRTYRIISSSAIDQCNDIEMTYHLTDKNGNTEQIVQAFSMRYFFKFEIEHLLSRSGFQIIEIFGNFDKSPLKDKSPEMIIMAEKK